MYNKQREIVDTEVEPVPGTKFSTTTKFSMCTHRSHKAEGFIRGLVKNFVTGNFEIGLKDRNSVMSHVECHAVPL